MPNGYNGCAFIEVIQNRIGKILFCICPKILFQVFYWVETVGDRCFCGM
jgi:hypothetical protein